MSDCPIARKLAGHVGEYRKPERVVVVELPVTVSIEWPEGVLYSDDVAKEVATSAVSYRYSRDVGAPGKIIWAECSVECCDDEATIIEGGDE